MSISRMIFTIIISCWCLSTSAQMFGSQGDLGKPSSQGVEIGVGSDPVLAAQTGSSSYPRVFLEFGTVDYFFNDSILSGTITEMSIQMAEDAPIVRITNTSLELGLIVDSNGDFVGGIPGDDLVLSGDVDADNDGIVDFSGVLLAGEATGYGAKDGTNGALDMFFFSFDLNGGAMFDLFGGGMIKMTMSANISSFTGTYDDDFKIFINDGYLVGNPTDVCTGTIGDYVWLDTNNDGIQNNGETGIDGVTLNLLDADGNTVSVTTVTGGPDNAPGYYQFSMLCAGPYTVSVDSATLPTGVEPTTIGAPGSTPENDSDNPDGTVVTLTGDSDSNQTIDFGFISPLGSLGDFVWLDTNENGIQDLDELGVEGVTVNLLDCSGTLLDTIDTDLTGFYEFTELVAGCYQVEFVLPDGFVFSPQFNGPTDTDSNADLNSGVSEPVTLLPGEDNPTIDAGIYQPALSSLGDFVWLDENMNGVQDPGESGIPDVFVTLLSCDGTVLDSVTTGSDGRYEFTELVAGCYKVMFGLPDGFTFSPLGGGPADLDSDANPSTGMSGMINLGVNEDNPTIDAGMYEPVLSSIGDFFWLDTDGDGVQDPGETGIEGVNVELFDCDGNSLGSMTTGADGDYLFGNLLAGCYQVVFTPPADCQLSPMNAGSDIALDSNANPATGQTDQINLGDSESNLTIDAGCYYTAGLGDYLWIDEDQDGVQGDTEVGVPGMLVELLDINMVPTGLTTVTGNNGEYSFTDLAPGKYFVQFTAPVGYVYTEQGVGGDEELDSNANGTGKTDMIMLDSGEFDPTIDAGVYLPQDPMIDIEKSTNGFDADDPTGPYIATDDVVTWTYTVTNTGNVVLSDIVVTDTEIGVINCPFTSLEPAESDVCTTTGIAIAGQYMNGSDVVGISPTGTEVVDNDPSHYFGSDPSIDIEKATNDEDADDPTGPLIPVGNTVTWTYVVTNTGNVPLTNVIVTDSDPSVSVTCPLTELQPIGQGVAAMMCMATGTAVLGQYENDSDVVGTPPVGPPVVDDDPSHYFGIESNISIEKSTNGVDADDPNSGDAPLVAPGDTVTWTYFVENTGNSTLTGIEVTDDQGVVVTCPLTSLAAGDSMTCEGEGIAVDLSLPGAGGVVPGVCGMTPNSNLYGNIGTAIGITPTEDVVTANDPSHYCNPGVCAVGIDATCLIPMPSTSDYVCDKPIDVLTFIWNGSSSVRIKAYKGSVGSTLLADIDNIVPGQEVSVSGFAGSPNDVYFEIFNAGTSTKIGESNFHLSCSDSAMNGPEDCGTPQGNGKGNNSGLINDWLLEGIVDEGGVLDCSPTIGTGTDSCEFLPTPVSCDTVDNVDTITLVYSGGSCGDSQNTQGSKFSCSGSLDGAASALVTLESGDSFSVIPGESFTIPESGSGTQISLANSGGTMNLDIHTSCSAPLILGDIFGSTTLLQINNLGNGTDVIYSYTVSNTGDTDLVSLSAIDVPLGPVLGLPDFLAAGDSVTVYNSSFVDTTTTNTVTVNATDADGAVCSDQDQTTVTVLSPPPCEVVGEGTLDIDKEKVKWVIDNTGNSTATIESITITWPEDVKGDLMEVKLAGDKIFDTDVSGGSVTINANDWIGDLSKRQLDAGKDETLEFKFANDEEVGADEYSISITFAEGCSLEFVNVGLPFSCNKPIDELVMIWNGSQNPVSIKAWKGNVGSQLLSEQADVMPGTEVAVSGYAGSPNDVYWEIFSNGNKIGESNFHMSCSDGDMNGAEDCGKAQGNGKSNDSGLINDWLLEGMTDEDGAFDCTP